MAGKRLRGIIVFLLFTTIMPSAAEAAGDRNYNDAGERAFAPVFGETLPPVGYVQFCERQPAECRPLGKLTGKVKLTEGGWRLLNQVNGMVNAKVVPISDIDLYQVAEHWGFPDEAGDCEDYVLLKKRYLEGLGLPAETLLITVVLDEAGDGHAILMVRTDKGDFVLDNRRDNILRWADTRYQFLKRQSQEDPRIWVALTNKSTRNQGMTAGGN